MNTSEKSHTTPPYPAARLAAARVQPHFSRHHADAIAHGTPDMAPEADAWTIELIVNAAFWASLRREEGFVPTISLAYLPPEPSPQAFTFESPLPLEPGSLTKLSPAVERPGIHLGVWRVDGELMVWGATRNIPVYCFVLEVLAPGLLVVKHRRGEQSGKFVNLAVLQGDEIKVLNQDAALLPDCPDVVRSLLGVESESSTGMFTNVLIQLAASMRAHKRGGTLLVVPAGSNSWRESIVQPIRYTVSPAFAELTELMRDEAAGRGERRWREALRRAVDAIAGLTAVDGATVLTSDYELLAFGAKIARRVGSPRVEQVILTEPIEDSEAEVVPPGQLGGTRHLSAAQFAQDQRDGVALVASQDGHFTVFAWSPCEGMVHAHRVEALLL